MAIAKGIAESGKLTNAITLVTPDVVVVVASAVVNAALASQAVAVAAVPARDRAGAVATQVAASLVVVDLMEAAVAVTGDLD